MKASKVIELLITDFLRKEVIISVKAKDKIIELLITGGNNISESRLNEVNKHKDPFLLPKKYGKVIYDEVKADVPVRNSFNPLSEKSLQINTNEPTNKKKKKYRSTTIIGDSIVRDIKQHKMRKALPENKIFVKSFSGATTECLEHYIHPPLRYKPDLIVGRMICDQKNRVK